jgi:putative membrane protein insertion efficiency factor
MNRIGPKNVPRDGVDARLLAGPFPRRGLVVNLRNAFGVAARRAFAQLATVHAALVWLVLLPVAFYRRVLSPMKRTPTCRFMPTCSEYAIEAVHKRGIVVGSALASWRILRCNPLFRGGYDPVPGASRDKCEHCEELNAGTR